MILVCLQPAVRENIDQGESESIWLTLNNASHCRISVPEKLTPPIAVYYCLRPHRLILH